MAFSLCSPAGWDNDKKIAILYENMHSVKPDQYYTDVIARPIVVRKVSLLQNQNWGIIVQDSSKSDHFPTNCQCPFK